MRVGLVGTHSAPAGSSSSSADELAPLAGALAASGVEVTVYACRHDPIGPDTVEMDAGYRVVYMPGAPGTAPPGDLSDAGVAPMMGEFARFLSDAWATDRPDVVNAGSWLYGVAAQLAADRHAIPTVQSLPQLSGVIHRRQGRHVGPATRPRFERLLARSASRVLVSCTEDLLDLVKLGCPRARLSVLPHAVDVERFSPIGPIDERSSDRGSDRRIVTVAGELLPHKGLEDLVRTLPRLPAAELVVVGGPSQHRLDWDAGACRLRSLAIDLGVVNRLHLTGWVAPERLPRILRSADAFACPSWYEPFGRPVVEAMSCGVPVVASEAGGMLDTIVHDVTGLLVPARNPVRLAKALEELLHGGPLRSGMGLAGRVRAQSRYSWERVAAEAHTVYESAVEDFRLRGVAVRAIGGNGVPAAGSSSNAIVHRSPLRGSRVQT